MSKITRTRAKEILGQMKQPPYFGGISRAFLTANEMTEIKQYNVRRGFFGGYLEAVKELARQPELYDQELKQWV